MSIDGPIDMPIDADRALAARVNPAAHAWTADDVIRYHLALGAGAPECSGPELRYVYEDVLHTLGTFACVPASAASALAMRVDGLDHDPATVIHGEQDVELFAPLPVAAVSTNVARVVAVYDTGRAALVEIAVDTAAADAAPLARSTFRLLLPGAGGFGGDAPQPAARPEPTGPPDAVHVVATLPQQAALYRMSGDRIPLHIDPAAARAAGFARPTLPGLCTWGMVAKAVVDRELDGDVTALASFSARFSGPVFPGETIEVSIWRDADDLAIRARVLERDAPALSRGRVRVSP